MLEKIRPFGSETDHLFIGTERFQYFTVSWNPKLRQLDTLQSFVDVSEKHMRDSQSLDRSSIDPKGQFLALELFAGVLNLINVVKPKKTRPQYLEDPEQVRITELKVRSSTFLHTESKIPKLALLYEGHKDGDMNVELATYRVTDEKGNYSRFDPARDREDDIRDLDLGASHLIPVPKGEEEGRRYAVRNSSSAKAHLGGVIVVGEAKMLYLDDESKTTVQYALDEATMFVAWSPIDGLRYLLAGEFGRLYLLTIKVDGPIVLGMDVKQLGMTSKASRLVYLGDNKLFVASHTGDTQLVHLDFEDWSLKIMQTIPNIAPILDFTIMDMGGRAGDAHTNDYSSGQARIVTGSGADLDGSMRSVRSGVGLEDIGTVAMLDNIRDLFPLRNSSNAEFTDTLLVSFSTETIALTFKPDGEIEGVQEYRGFALDENTLLAANLPHDRLVQVTGSGVRLASPEGYISWDVPVGKSITSASGNDDSLLIVLGGRVILSLNIADNLQELARLDVGEKDQVACIHVPFGVPDICLVGFWKCGSVSILNTKSLELIQTEDLAGRDDASVPRDIVMAQILPEALSGPTLFIAMADGNVLSFNVDKTDHSLSGKRSITLGALQAKFQILPRDDGLFNVFTTCEHPSLIYGSEGRIVYSAVTAEDATCVCSFNAEAFQKSIAVATDTMLKLSEIDSTRRTHVQTLPLGETVRRIAYSPSEKVFGLGSIKRELRFGEEIVSSSFRLVDEVQFGELGKPFHLHQDAEGIELVETVIRAQLTAPYGKDNEEALPDRFIVGTSYLTLPATAGSDRRGRILVFGVDSDRNPYLMAEQPLKGACRRLAVLNGKIVAALIKTVVMYSYTEDVYSGSFTKIASYRTSTCPIDIVVEGNIIAVGDMQKSMSLVEYIPGEKGQPDKLTEVARHYQTSFTTAISHVDGDFYLTGDADGNLMMLRQNTEGVTESDKKKMDITSELNIGEQVNVIRKIVVDKKSGATVQPRALLATTEGSIYLVATINERDRDLLMRLQSAIADKIASPGDIPFSTYRAFKTAQRESEEPYRFVDGEMVERFLGVPETAQEDIIRGGGLGVTAEYVRNLVEELKRLH